jgi:hypothetical protein
MRVDPDKVEAQLSSMLAALAPYTEGDEPRHVLARMQMQVLPAIVRWKTSEMNRGSAENDVLNAFVCMVSSQMAGIVGEVIGSADFGDPHFEMVNSLLQAIAEEVGSIMSGEREMQNFNVRAEATH